MGRTVSSPLRPKLLILSCTRTEPTVEPTPLMSIDPARYKHTHNFLPDRTKAEKATYRVILLTAAMMILEIVAGWRFHSMALLADGWHMSTHVAAFLITALAYILSRRLRSDPSFSFGTGKMDVLGGYTSALILGAVALFMAFESIHRLFSPLPIHYTESIIIGSVGLCVNVASALLLKHDHGHEHGHDHHHGHAHHDLNMRAAYIHVIADAVTSVFAIVALVAGKYLGFAWLDPIMGIFGSVVVAQWAIGLIKDTSCILLDRTPHTDLVDEITRTVEETGDAQVTDLHVWQLAAGQFSAIVSIVSETPRDCDHYHQRFKEHDELRHVTIEIRSRAE